MKRLVGGLVALGLAVVLVAPLPGEDAKKPEKKKDAYAGIFSFPKAAKITLDDKQQEKLDAIKTEYSPKLVEVDKKRAAILTPDRMKAGAEARKKAADDGEKDKKALNKIAAEAMKITKDEQKELGQINKDRSALVKEIKEKMTALLTDEQKEAAKPKPKPPAAK